MPANVPPIHAVSTYQQQSRYPAQLNVFALADDTSYAGVMNKVKVIFAEKLHISPDRVQPDCSPKELGADTLAHIELIMLCESRFDITIPDADAVRLINVRDIVLFVQRELIRIGKLDKK